MRAEDAEELVEQEFLERRGKDPVTVSKWVTGEDHTAELDQVKASIARLERESDAGLISTEEDEERHIQRMQSLVSRRDSLAAMPQRAAGWSYEETGETYEEAWHAADTSGKRKMLVDAGVKLYITHKHEYEILVPTREELLNGTQAP